LHPEPLLTPSYWLQGLLIAIFAAAFPYTLDILALKHLSKLSYGTLSSLSPVLAALAGLIFLHEYLSLLQWIALIFIMIASIGVTLRKETAESA
jgi:inner membrane transporter RhtA